MRRLVQAIPLLLSSTLLVGAALANRSEATPETLGTVTFYMATECPVSMRYTPRLQALHAEWSERGFSFEARFPQEADTKSEIATYIAERGYPFEWTKDVAGELAKADGVDLVPTVVVRSASGELLYRGAIDDNKSDSLVKNAYLADALAAIAAGESPEQTETEPFGCLLMPGEPMPAMEEVNYAAHVKTILDTHCVECHRPGEVAPFSLEGYDNARQWSRMIAWVAEQGIMPPWPAAEGYGSFKHENRLDDRQIALLERWHAAGSPSGDLDAAPATPDFPDGWTLGQPDVLLQMPVEHEIAATGRDEYWHFVLQPDIDDTVFVDAIDVHAGNPEVVHHVIAFIDRSGASERVLEQRGNGYGYETFGGPGFVPTNTLGGWAPGTRAQRLPEGVGMRLEPGDRVVLQVHYHKTGKPEVDRTEVGLYLTEAKIEDELEVAWVANPMIRIEAGDPEARFTMGRRFGEGARLYWVMPHMHLLGQSMKAHVEYPDGTQEPLVFVPRWNFDWQFVYHLQEPMDLPPGSRIMVEAVFDNSASNPFNPNDPPQTVRWGEQTTDEMMLLVAGYAPLD